MRLFTACIGVSFWVLQPILRKAFNRKMFSRIKKIQSGRSMMEMLGVLAIVGVLSTGGIAGYSFAMEEYRTNLLIERVYLMASQTRRLFKKGDYTDFTVDNLKVAERIDNNNNPFGGLLLSSDPGTTQLFNIYTELYNVPTRACVRILRSDWGDKGVFYAVVVDDNDGNTANVIPFYSTPVPADDAVAACGNGNRRMLWYLK